MVEKEGFAGILQWLKSSNQYDPKFALSNSGLLPFKIDTTLKTKLKENFDCIYFREGKNKTNVTGNNFRRVANKL